MAFRDTLKPLLKQPHQHALVLGTGGASKAIVFALQELGIQPKLVSRNATNYSITYNDLSKEIMEQHCFLFL